MQLMYKLDPSDFKTEKIYTEVDWLLGILTTNRQVLPNARQKIGSYYRQLAKRSQYFWSGRTVHDEMLKALSGRGFVLGTENDEKGDVQGGHHSP